MSRRPPARDGAVRTGRAVALLVGAVVVAVLLLRHVGSTTTVSTAGSPSPVATAPPTTPAPAPTSTTSTTVPAPPPSQVKLLVLNGTGSGSLAGTTSRRLASNPGYDTLAPDDTTSKVTSSAVYAVTPQYVGAAQALAATLRLPPSAVQASLPSSAPVRISERSIADVVLVLGPDLPPPAASSSSTSTTSAAR